MWAPALRCAPSRPALRRGTHPNSSKLPSLMTRRAFTSGCRKFWTVHTRQKPRSAPSVGRTRARPGLPCGAGAFRIPLGLAAGAPPQSVTGGAGKARQTRLSSHADRRCVTASKLCIYLPPVWPRPASWPDADARPWPSREGRREARAPEGQRLQRQSRSPRHSPHMRAVSPDKCRTHCVER